MINSDPEYRKSWLRSRRKLILKSVEELYDKCEDENLSTITLKINFNPYNMGHKMESTYMIDTQPSEK